MDMLNRDSDAGRDVKEALSLYRRLCPQDSRPYEELTDNDFDKNIMFWSSREQGKGGKHGILCVIRLDRVGTLATR